MPRATDRRGKPLVSLTVVLRQAALRTQQCYAIVVEALVAGHDRQSFSNCLCYRITGNHRGPGHGIGREMPLAGAVWPL
jgi:hypothetical protein